MATYATYLDVPGFTAVSSLASAQYYIVQLATTAGQVKLATSGTSKIIGVVQNDPVAGQPADIARVGVFKVAAETSVAIGDALTSSSTGRAKTTTTGGNLTIGIALDATTTAGDIIRCAGPGSVMGD